MKLFKYKNDRKLLVVLVLSIISGIAVWTTCRLRKVNRINDPIEIVSLSNDNELNKYPVGIRSEIPVETKIITYKKGKNIFLRKLNNNRLLDEEVVITNEADIGDYVFDDQVRWVAYSYFSDINNYDNNDDLQGSGDILVLKNLKDGRIEKVISDLKKGGLVASFSFEDKSNNLYISLDNNDIYRYSIDDRKLDKIFESISKKNDGFCRGFTIDDESGDGKKLILSSRCYEGTIKFVYYMDTKKMTEVGGGYGEGKEIVKFDGDQLYGYEYYYEDDMVANYAFYDLNGKKIRDLPSPTKTKSPIFGLYHEDTTDKIFIADLAKSTVPDKVDMESRQVIGFGVKDIQYYY